MRSGVLLPARHAFAPPQLDSKYLALTAILKVYAAEDINDLLSMCLVSRDFHAVTTVWLYRSIILDWNCSDRILELLAERMTSRTAYYVREINASSGRFGCDDYQLKLLQSVVQRLPTLRRFK